MSIYFLLNEDLIVGVFSHTFVFNVPITELGNIETEGLAVISAAGSVDVRG
jgi:hypothetical protein